MLSAPMAAAEVVALSESTAAAASEVAERSARLVSGLPYRVQALVSRLHGEGESEAMLRARAEAEERTDVITWLSWLHSRGGEVLTSEAEVTRALTPPDGGGVGPALVARRAFYVETVDDGTRIERVRLTPAGRRRLGVPK